AEGPGQAAAAQPAADARGRRGGAGRQGRRQHRPHGGSVIVRRCAYAGLLLGLMAAAAGAASAAERAVAVAGDTATRVSAGVDPDGTTPLHWAVYNGDLKQVESQIRARADVNARNRFGSTPLYEAALAGHTGILLRLLKAGAHPDAANAGGMTAL